MSLKPAERFRTPDPTLPEKIRIPAFGTAISPYRQPELFAFLDACIQRQKRALVEYVNLDALHLVRSVPEYREMLNQRAAVVLPDGMWTVWLARLAGVDVPERLALTDVVPDLMAHATRKEYSVFVLGSSPETLLQAKSVLHERGHLPHTVACWSRPRASLDDPRVAGDVLAHMAEVQPDLLLVALGAPFQSRWIEAHWDQLPPCAIIMVGGAFDYLAGSVGRAPVWMQQTGMEWLFRLCTDRQKRERSLFERYVLTDIPLALGLLWRIFRHPQQPRREGATL